MRIEGPKELGEIAQKEFKKEYIPLFGIYQVCKNMGNGMYEGCRSQDLNIERMVGIGVYHAIITAPLLFSLNELLLK